MTLDEENSISFFFHDMQEQGTSKNTYIEFRSEESGITYPMGLECRFFYFRAGRCRADRRNDYRTWWVVVFGVLLYCAGGEGGIRTPGTLSSTTA